ncbi:MAG: hypothetical protein FWG67_06030 [Defluviitaleaceae bacterium]|nr:hypothetical protein [Defluviitaleaceae bacterium]
MNGMDGKKDKKKRKVKNKPVKEVKINQKEEISKDFFDYFEDDEPYQEIQIT